MSRKATSAARPKGQRSAPKPSATVPPKEEPTFGTGKLTKEGSGYLESLIAKIKMTPNHPRHKRVQMQAHHLISASGVKMLPVAFKRNIEYFNYNINDTSNLAFLPCTLQGACHLGIQPHRGNHTVKLGHFQEEPDDDRYHEDDYHDMVKRRLLGLQPLIKKKCVGECSKAELELLIKRVKSELDLVSLSILLSIQTKPDEAPLTKLAIYFQPGNPIGCAGVDSVNGRNEGKDHHLHRCPVERNHFMRQGPGQDEERIGYPVEPKHVFSVGH